MSRIGRLPITVPAGVDLKIDGQDVTAKGPKGELSLTVAAPITVAWRKPPSPSAARTTSANRVRCTA